MEPGKLLVTTGSPTSTSVKTETFDVATSTTCKSMPAYPLPIAEATGAFVNSRVVICGGYHPVTSQCYSLGQNENEWKPSGNLITPRYSAASAVINDKLIIFGGYNAGNLQSTEEIDVAAGTASQGPSMPLAMVYHCAVKLNTSTVLIIGGYGSSYLRSTYFYSFKEKTFKAGPDLKATRSRHECALLDTGTASYVVVTGGYGDSGYLDSTEYMDCNEPTIWKTGL